MFSKKSVLSNFTGKFTGKHLCHSLFFDKVVGLRPATLLKKRLSHRCFPVYFVKFVKTPFFHRIHPVSASKMIEVNMLSLSSHCPADIKGAPVLYFMYYLHVVITLFGMGFHKSVFSIYSFVKLGVHLSMFSFFVVLYLLLPFFEVEFDIISKYLIAFL